jgi:hypothetical protein
MTPQALGSHLLDDQEGDANSRVQNIKQKILLIDKINKGEKTLTFMSAMEPSSDLVQLSMLSDQFAKTFGLLTGLMDGRLRWSGCKRLVRARPPVRSDWVQRLAEQHSSGWQIRCAIMASVVARASVRSCMSFSSNPQWLTRKLDMLVTSLTHPYSSLPG